MSSGGRQRRKRSRRRASSSKGSQRSSHASEHGLALNHEALHGMFESGNTGQRGRWGGR